MLLFAVVSLATITLFAQVDTTGTGGGGDTNPLTLLFGSLTALSVVIIPITMAGIKAFGIKEYRQAFSWVVGIALAAVAKWFGLGIFVEFDWFWTLSNGFITALMANGATNISWVRAILDAVYNKYSKA